MVSRRVRWIQVLSLRSLHHFLKYLRRGANAANHAHLPTAWRRVLGPIEIFVLFLGPLSIDLEIGELPFKYLECIIGDSSGFERVCGGGGKQKFSRAPRRACGRVYAGGAGPWAALVGQLVETGVSTCQSLNL